MNHVQNISVIATKCGLVQTMKEFETKEKYFASSFGLHSSIFMPETYRLDLTRDEMSSEELAFLHSRNAGNTQNPSNQTGGLWINKPMNANCGRGIQMIADVRKFKDEFVRLKAQSFSIR